MKRFKFIAGFIFGAMIFGSVGAFAASGGNMIEVFYTIKDIKIDNVSKMPEQKPFAYQGTTYVPLRYIAEALGEPVGWDQKTQTVLIGKTEKDVIVYPGNGIESMNVQVGSTYRVGAEYKYNSTQKATDNLGNEYSNYIAFNIDRYTGASEAWAYYEFPLNGQYKRFKAKVGLDNDYKNTTDTLTLNIYADDKEIYTKEIQAGDFPEELNLDISNVLKLKIEVKSTSNDDSQLDLFNAYFTK